MILTLFWYGFGVVAPAALAKASLRRGQRSLLQSNYDQARQHLARAASYAPLREQAVELLAEAAILNGRPAEAIYELNAMLLEQAGVHPAPSRRTRLLRAIAGCMIGKANAARRELAEIPREDATLDELLAAAQACILANDIPGARQLCELLRETPCEGVVAARVRLCRAAILYRQGHWADSLETLPADSECSPEDRVACEQVRWQCQQKLRRAAGGWHATAS